MSVKLVNLASPTPIICSMSFAESSYCINSFRSCLSLFTWLTVISDCCNTTFGSCCDLIDNYEENTIGTFCRFIIPINVSPNC